METENIKTFKILKYVYLILAGSFSYVFAPSLSVLSELYCVQ